MEANAAINHVIDAELEQRSGDEIEWAHRALCSMILVKTAMASERPAVHSKEAVYQKCAAQDWLEGGVGVWTFEEVCEGVGLHPDRARESIRRHAGASLRAPINRESRRTFGRNPNDPFAETTATCGVGSGYSDADGSKCRQAWAG